MEKDIKQLLLYLYAKESAAVGSRVMSTLNFVQIFVAEFSCKIIEA